MILPLDYFVVVYIGKTQKSIDSQEQINFVALQRTNTLAFPAISGMRTALIGRLPPIVARFRAVRERLKHIFSCEMVQSLPQKQHGSTVRVSAGSSQ